MKPYAESDKVCTFLRKGYSNWIEGFIHDIEEDRHLSLSPSWLLSIFCQRIIIHIAIPSCNTLPGLPHLTSIGVVELSLEQPFIRETQCNCKAGLGQCNHLIGLLYTLAHIAKMGYTSVPPSTSKTSLPQAWHVPSRALGVSPRTPSSFYTVLEDTEACYYGGMVVTQAVAIQLEIETREQSHSKTWHKV
ncbi:unnamed protein product [Boreogadus saida]